jgi:hypothetical protein
MYGLAGTGKTTVAYSFAELLASEQRLGASFFCSRAQADLRDTKHIFPFIAFQLARTKGDFQRRLLLTLDNDPIAGHRSLEYQIDELLVKPLKEVSASEPPVVVVVDALDECEDSKATSKIVSLIARHANAFSGIKFFVTSRSEHHIIEGFRSALSQTQKLILHEVNLVEVNEEIKGYLRNRLEEIGNRRRAEIPLENWPPKHLLQALAERCGGFWIFASTACTLVDDEFNDPHSRLEAIANVAIDGDNAVYSLYSQIFKLVSDGLSNRMPSDQMRSSTIPVVL